MQGRTVLSGAIEGICRSINRHGSQARVGLYGEGGVSVVSMCSVGFEVTDTC
jgi:hypothetical protein